MKKFLSLEYLYDDKYKSNFIRSRVHDADMSAGGCNTSIEIGKDADILDQINKVISSFKMLKVHIEKKSEENN